MDVQPYEPHQHLLSLNNNAGELAGKRQLPIRARSTPGQVAGAANYKLRALSP
jgi:hypothetical protein